MAKRKTKKTAKKKSKKTTKKTKKHTPRRHKVKISCGCGDTESLKKQLSKI